MIRPAPDCRAALLALLVCACGGNATENADDSGPSAGGGNTGGAVMPGPEEPGEVDPLLDENFDEALEKVLRESCRLQVECSGSTQWGDEDECTQFFEDFAHANYDLESRECRAAMLDAYDCYNETWTCENGDNNCSAQELTGCLLFINDD